jgi:hypothetical protein
MDFLRQLGRVQLWALVSLIAVAAVAAGSCAAFTAMWSGASLSPAQAALLFFVYAMVVGCGPALLLGAPAYAVLRRYRRATWWTALAVGCAPGLCLLLVVDRRFALLALACGAAVAAVTHGLCRRLEPRVGIPGLLALGPTRRPQRPPREHGNDDGEEHHHQQTRGQ